MTLNVRGGGQGRDRGWRSAPLPGRRPLRSLGALALALALIGAAAPAAAQPVTVLFEGVLRSAGGAPAADGDYALTFALYKDKVGGSALWSEKADKVALSGGTFAYALGTVTPISAVALAEALYLGVSVGAEPELTRVALHAVAFARLAGSAATLSCTGCVGAAQLKFDGDLDLGGNSIKAKNAILSGDLVAKAVTAQSFAGDGSKLTGIKVPAGACKAGEVMVGIGADGALQCKAQAAAGGDLATLTGGLLTSKITTAAKPGNLPMAIPDNTGAEAAALATIAEAGKIEAIAVSVGLVNSDLGKIRLVLLPPDDKQVGITLCDPCGASGEKQLNLSWPPAKEKAGSLAGYVGKSAKGIWTIKVLDSGFCIPQLPGNAGICDLNKGTDGALQVFSVSVEVQATATVAVPGTLIAQGALQLPVNPEPAPPCSTATRGSTYVDASKGRLVVCDGADWRTLPFEKACGNGIQSGDEACDDGNSIDTDACTAACKKAACGDGVVHKDVEVCDDGNTNDGDGCSADCSKITGNVCANGSYTDCNPPGVTKIASSAFVDKDKLSGWVQCMGFVNTAGDDVAPNAMDGCFNSTQLRLRIWDDSNKVVVDVWELQLKPVGSWWSGGQYYDGGNSSPALVTNVCGALWPCGNNAGFYGSTNGSGGGGCGGYPAGMTLSNGNGGQITVSPGGNSANELTQGPCYGNSNYANYKIAVYKQP